MAGRERELLEMLPPRDHDHRYMEADNTMRDFWTSTSDRESLQEMRESRGGRDGHAVADMREHPPQSPYSYGAHLQQDPSENVVTMAVRSSLGSVHHEATFYTDYHPYHHHLDSSATSKALLPTYTNFFNASCVDNHGLKPEPDEPRYITNPENEYNHGEGRYYSSTWAPPVAIPMSHDVFSVTTASESIHGDHDMDSLRRELAYKCPRSSDLLMAITSTAEATVREHGSATSGVSSDDDDDEAPHDTDQNPRLSDPDQDLRGAIVDHPYYPDMVDSHIRIFKIGAPRELRNKLDEVTKKFHRFQEGTMTRIGDDPSLDCFMKSYVDLLTKLGDDLEEPFNRFMQFKDATAKSLENICGHYIETVPDETDNYGFDIGPTDGAQNSDELDMLGDGGSLYSYGAIDDSIVIDPTAPEEELRKMLMMKYGRHIGGLKAEFNRVRKKGKLPSHARSILKDWFNRHSYWPYPSEVEKQYLQQICSLNLKQINNWFINERKRHWSCEGKCMHPNAKLYNSGSEGKSNSEHAE